MNSSTEETAIRETINYYVEGRRTGSVETLKQGFHQQAILCGYLGDEMIAAPIEGLYDWLNSNPAPAETVRSSALKNLIRYHLSSSTTSLRTTFIEAI